MSWVQPWRLAYSRISHPDRGCWACTALVFFLAVSQGYRWYLQGRAGSIGSGITGRLFFAYLTETNGTHIGSATTTTNAWPARWKIWPPLGTRPRPVGWWPGALCEMVRSLTQVVGSFSECPARLAIARLVPLFSSIMTLLSADRAGWRRHWHYPPALIRHLRSWICSGLACLERLIGLCVAGLNAHQPMHQIMWQVLRAVSELG